MTELSQLSRTITVSPTSRTSMTWATNFFRNWRNSSSTMTAIRPVRASGTTVHDLLKRKPTEDTGVNGPMPLTPPARDTRTAQASKAASTDTRQLRAIRTKRAGPQCIKWSGFRLLEPFHHPDITALRFQPVKEHPLPVRRPYWIINAHTGIGEFEHLLRARSLKRCDPQHFVPDHVHDA